MKREELHKVLELHKLWLDTDKKEAGIQSGGNKKKLSDIRALNLAKTFKRGV